MMTMTHSHSKAVMNILDSHFHAWHIESVESRSFRLNVCCLTCVTNANVKYPVVIHTPQTVKNWSAKKPRCLS